MNAQSSTLPVFACLIVYCILKSIGQTFMYYPTLFLNHLWKGKKLEEKMTDG